MNVENKIGQKIIWLIVFFVVICFVLFLLALKNNFIFDLIYDFNEEKEFFKNENNDLIDLYKVNKNNFFVCMNGKLKLMDFINEREKWSESLNFVEPVFQNEKKIFGVSDIKSNLVSIYNLDGKLYDIKINAGENLLAFFVSENGCCVCITKGENFYNINVYNQSGEKILSNVYHEENIFPVGADISPDGKILAIDYVDLNNIKPESKIVFMRVDNQNIFGSVQEKGNFIHGINFISNEQIILFDKHEIICKEIKKNNIKEKWRIKFNSTISEVDFNENFLVVKIDNQTESFLKSRSLIEIYNINSGQKKSFFEAKNQIDFINFDKELNYILLAGLNNFFVIDVNGKVLFENNLTGEYKKACFLNKTNKILFLRDDKILLREFEKKSNNNNNGRNQNGFELFEKN